MRARLRDAQLESGPRAAQHPTPHVPVDQRAAGEHRLSRDDLARGAEDHDATLGLLADGLGGHTRDSP
jgi:hypothetical protein